MVLPCRWKGGLAREQYRWVGEGTPLLLLKKDSGDVPFVGSLLSVLSPPWWGRPHGRLPRPGGGPGAVDDLLFGATGVRSVQPASFLYGELAFAP